MYMCTNRRRWFAVNMGTGIVSILLHNLPYNGTWLQYISYIIFAANVALFLAFLVMTILRYVLYPQIWTAMILHPSQSLFLGCFPMGLASKFAASLSDDLKTVLTQPVQQSLT